MRLQNGYDPIVPRDFLQKRHLRQSHCKMSIPTFVQTVVLYLLTFVQSFNQVEKKIQDQTCSDALVFLGLSSLCFSVKTSWCKRGISERLLAPFWCRGIGSYVVISYVVEVVVIYWSRLDVSCCGHQNEKKLWKGGVGVGSNGLKRT